MKSILLITSLLAGTILCAQSGAPHPKFSNFVGDAYKMEIVETLTKKGTTVKGLVEKYGDFVYDYPKIAEIDIPSLNIPETYISDKKFPGIDRSTQYAMILEAKMTITAKACYEFSLNSDDGSILWIDDKKVIDNDGGHGMTMKMDSLVYDPGTYDVKVWYFQSYADRFGLQLDAKIIGRPDVCLNQEPETNQVALNFGSTVFFDSGSSVVKSSAITEIKKLAGIIDNKNVKSLTLTGHTDNQGTKENNQGLSQRRAQSIAEALKEILGDKIPMKTIGLGETAPIATNETKEGRGENRRVELVLTLE